MGWGTPSEVAIRVWAVWGATAIAAGALATAGCGGGGDDSERGSQDIVSNTCGIISGVDGHTLTSDELDKLNDPVAKRIIRGSCPQKLDGIFDALRSAKDCPKSSIKTRLV